MATLSIQFWEGKFKDATMYAPCEVEVNDCRDGETCPPFVSVGFRDKDRSKLSAYLPPELAEKLADELAKLFPKQDNPEQEGAEPCSKSQ